MRKLISILLCSVSVVFCEQVSVDTSGSDSSGDGSVASPFRTIQFAIEHNNTSNGDIILVGPGTYTENINFRGKDITVGSLTLTTGNKSYVSETIIDGGSPSNSDSASVVTFIGGETSSAKLVGFTIQNGSGTKVGSEKRGGGIYTINSSPSLKHLVIVNNSQSIKRGAGIFFGKKSNAFLDSSTVWNNTATSYGGGIYIDTQSDVTLDSVLISKNNASLGGGVFLPKKFSSASPIFRRVGIISNEATDGGGVYSGSNASGKLQLSNVTVAHNNASRNGGGFYLHKASNAPEI